MSGFKNWLHDWEVSHLASKAVGLCSSVVASHVGILMTTPDYAHFWASWSLTAPQIINKAAFEEKMTSVLGVAWLFVDHFLWKFSENNTVTGSPTIQIEKTAPLPGGERKDDPKGETK